MDKIVTLPAKSKISGADTIIICVSGYDDMVTPIGVLFGKEDRIFDMYEVDLQPDLEFVAELPEIKSWWKFWRWFS